MQMCEKRLHERRVGLVLLHRQEPFLINLCRALHDRNGVVRVAPACAGVCDTRPQHSFLSVQAPVENNFRAQL
jgi:hypothetical protein